MLFSGKEKLFRKETFRSLALELIKLLDYDYSGMFCISVSYF